MLLKDVRIDGWHHDIVLAVDDERALLDLLQIAVAACRGDRTPFSKSDELGLADLGPRFWFAVQFSRGDPVKPSLACRATRRAPRTALGLSIRGHQDWRCRISAALLSGTALCCDRGAAHSFRSKTDASRDRAHHRDLGIF